LYRYKTAAHAAAGQLSTHLGVSSGGATNLVSAAAMGQQPPSSAITMAANQAMVQGATTGAARAAAFAAALNAQHAAGGKAMAAAERHNAANSHKPHFESELEVNDFPQHARWKVTHKDSLQQISEFTGAAITTRGQYYPPGKGVPPGERRLYLLIEGPTVGLYKLTIHFIVYP
jgi:ATP-dependent RNA helicase DDX46/PRP5